MAVEHPDDTTLGTAGSNDGAPRPLKTKPTRPGTPGERSKAGDEGPQDRPGSNPKNPGDFGHH